MFNIGVQLITQSLLSYTCISPLLLNLSVWNERDIVDPNIQRSSRPIQFLHYLRYRTTLYGMSRYGFYHESTADWTTSYLLQTPSVWNVWVWTLTWRRVHLPTSPLPLRQRWWSLLPPWMSAHLHYQPHSHRLPGTSVQWAPSSEMNGTWKKIALRKCHFNKLIAND